MMAMHGWDLGYLLALSEARNRHAAAHGCNGFRTPPFPTPPYREDYVMAPGAREPEAGCRDDRVAR